MPTAHRRHTIAETEDISDALEVGARVWPHLAHKPGALLRQLVLAGRSALADRDRATAGNRRQAVEATSGALAGAFGADYLEELRKDWPES